jgi:hypothetical protein
MSKIQIIYDPTKQKYPRISFCLDKQHPLFHVIDITTHTFVRSHSTFLLYQETMNSVVNTVNVNLGKHFQIVEYDYNDMNESVVFITQHTCGFEIMVDDNTC